LLNETSLATHCPLLNASLSPILQRLALSKERPDNGAVWHWEGKGCKNTFSVKGT